MPIRSATIAILGLAGLASAAQAQSYYNYECADGAHFELALYPENKFAFVQIDGKSLQLPKRFSVTSQRFSKNGVTVSMKSGGAATIRRAGRTSQCKLK